MACLEMPTDRPAERPSVSPSRQRGMVGRTHFFVPGSRHGIRSQPPQEDVSHSHARSPSLVQLVRSRMSRRRLPPSTTLCLLGRRWQQGMPEEAGFSSEAFRRRFGASQNFGLCKCLQSHVV